LVVVGVHVAEIIADIERIRWTGDRVRLAQPEITPAASAVGIDKANARFDGDRQIGIADSGDGANRAGVDGEEPARNVDR
jgi:hypothetical protein